MGPIKELNLTINENTQESTTLGKSHLAVSVQNASKKYASKKHANQILNNLTLSVEQGHIYSLLGASGCGKTTLLSCVVGLKSLDSGTILVFGAEPGTKGSGVPGRKVGYMPQEIALYGEFSIFEVLQYYGRLYGMPKWEIEDNTKFLITFLNLPPGIRRINSLSGGQQRRVSFAVALVHNPQLLILDEPTVGVDPLLRQSIWSHLVKLAETTKTTVIITTHFIEEARESNCIGLMRNGKLLAEDSPTNLMNKYNTSILEEIVVQLCLRDEAKQPEEEAEVILNSSAASQRTTSAHSNNASLLKFPVQAPDLNSIPDKTDDEILPANRRQSLGNVLHRASLGNLPEKHDFKTEVKEKSQRIYALVSKNVLVLLRNIIFLLFIVALPGLQVVLTCLAIGSDPHGIKIGVVNNELGSDVSCASLTAKPGCIMGPLEKYNSYASCQFIKELDTEIFTLVSYDNEEEALNDVKMTKIWGIMVFPGNFTHFLKERVLYAVYSDPITLQRSRIEFRLDMSNKQIGLQIQKNFYSTLKDFMYAMAKDCKVDTGGLDTPLYFDDPVFGTDDTNFTDFVAPGVLLSILFFYPLCSTGISMITEKKSGAMERTKVAGVTDLELMISHFVTQSVVLLIQSILSYVIMISVFKIRVQGSILLAYLIGLAVGVSGISFGFFMASVCRDELEAVMVSIGSFLPNFMLSGVIWPLEGMPFYLKNFSYALPCTLAGETLRSVIGRGVSFSHISVWPGFLSTAIYTCVYWLLTIGVTKLKIIK